jgi:hypothetical protein
MICLNRNRLKANQQFTTTRTRLKFTKQFAKLRIQFQETRDSHHNAEPGSEERQRLLIVLKELAQQAHRLAVDYVKKRSLRPRG